jgi:hypothetical protein
MSFHSAHQDGYNLNCDKVEPLRKGYLSHDTKSKPFVSVRFLSKQGIESHQSHIPLCQSSITCKQINESQIYPINNTSPNPNKGCDQSSSSIC